MRQQIHGLENTGLASAVRPNENVESVTKYERNAVEQPQALETQLSQFHDTPPTNEKGPHASSHTSP